ncbi:MAG: DUF4238 domain-containing protein [Solirubrobacterales bacterium]
MEYTEVKNAHIVPRCYLRNFAVDDAVILHIDGKELKKPISIDAAAIRKRFYRRFRPDGTPNLRRRVVVVSVGGRHCPDASKP